MPPVQATAPAAATPKRRRGIPWKWILGLIVLLAIGSQFGRGGNNTTTTGSNAANATAEPVATQIAIAADTPEQVAADQPQTEPTAVPTPTVEPTTPPTAEPTAAPKGASRESAAAVGEAVTTEAGWEIKTTGIERNATQLLKQANQFNDEPGEGKEWVIVHLQAKYLGGREETGKLSGTEVRLTGDRGVIYGYTGVVLEKPFAGETFKDGMIEGDVAFQVMQDEHNLITIFDPGTGSDAAFLAAEAITPPIVPPAEPDPAARDADRTREAPATGPVLADNGAQVRVVAVRRDATAEVQQNNQFNAAPAEGMEHVVADVEMQYFGDDPTFAESSTRWRVVGEKNVIYESTFAAMKNDYSGEVFKYGILAGSVVFEVPKGEGNLVFIYSGGGTSARYIAAPQ